MARVMLEGIRKEFGETVAVRDFTVTIEDGEFVTFLGPSGCGKTTSLRVVAGFIEPTEGAVTIGKRVVSDPQQRVFVPPEERGVGMVFQSYAVWPHMDVFANVAYPLKIKKADKKEMKRRVGDVLSLVKMPELADRYPHQLSGGQQQRVALARALVMDPEVLLLDEPLSNLDAKLREEMRLELKELQHQTGVTIIFVTHDQLEAMVLSDRVVVMREGAIQQIGTPAEIYRQPTNRFVADFIGVANFIECQRDEDGLRPLAAPDIVLPVAPPEYLADDRVTLMVRPEEIEMDRREGQITALVDKRMFLGDATEYIVLLGQQALRVKTEPKADFASNETVYLTITKYHFFAAS
jgi:iron(III) transport system ATP-binding protein